MKYLPLLLAALTLSLGASLARADEQASPVEPALTNTTCPVQLGEKVDPQQYVDYEGQRVYFCCRMCKAKFKRDPQAYLANLPQFAKASSNESPPIAPASVSEHAGEHSEQDTVKPSQSDTHEETDAHDHMEATADHDHDHAAHGASGGGGKTGLAKLIAWLGNFHPPAVNFPIALLASAALAELLVMLTGKPFFEAAARFSVWIGSLGAVGATVLGWFFAGFRLSDPTWVMTVHRWLGTAAGVWSVVVLVLCIAAYRPGETGRKWRTWYRLALFGGAAAVAVNGFLGGAMIYGLDHYAW